MDYRLFYEFSEQFAPQGFTGMAASSPIFEKLGEQMKAWDQSFHVADLLKIRILYCDPRMGPMIGLPYGTTAAEIDPSSFIRVIHPEDSQRHDRALAKLISLGFSMRTGPDDSLYYCQHFRVKDLNGTFNTLLYQAYLFRTRDPVTNIYLLMVVTNINHFVKRNPGAFYYLGQERNFFRYPDDEMLKRKIHLSPREISILDNISKGYSSEQIGAILFLSRHTIDTHRRNILKKNGAHSINELIYNLKDAGLL
jgi:DNA-binding CsgD family transcriptional regulator